MATVRRPMVSNSRTSSQNPFDSDDDESSSLKASTVSASSSSTGRYSNPFDDEADSLPKRSTNTVTRGSRGQGLSHDGGPQKSLARQRHTSAAVVDARNPFDDDGESPPAVKSKEGSLKSSLDQGTLFDEDYKPKADFPSDGHEDGQGRRKSGRARQSQFRGRVVSSGDAALKKAQKLKDAGVDQASKLMEGGLNQAQKLKESSHKAFKPNGGNGEKLGHTQARDHLFGDEGESQYKSSSSSYGATRTRYNDNLFQSGDLESRSMQELEGYAVQKTEDTTKSILNSLKVAEEIKGDATKTLLTLHEQGEQINRTHELALDIDQNLSAGEKLLGSLGGIFSKTWKPKKTRTITGPMVLRNDSFKRRGNHLEQRVALGLVRSNSKGRTSHSSPDSYGQPQQQTIHAKLEVERTKQDDALSDLSNVLDQLKEMSLDMGSEISRQNVALDHVQDDVIELGERVKGANTRGRRLLGK